MSAKREHVLVVEPALRGIQLVDFLEQGLADSDRVQLRQLVTAGGVRINGEVTVSGRRLRAGDVVQVVHPGARRRREPADQKPVLPTVLFESKTTLVVDKPSGIPTVPDRSGRERGVHGLLEQLRPGEDLRIVHRLDRGTSGCLVLGKGLLAAQHFDSELQAARVKKHYMALVQGVIGTPTVAIDAYLGPDPKRPGKVIASSTPRRGFREAHTSVAVRTTYARHTVVDLWPTTGRAHQLRVHLASIGHPIVGDGDYGGDPLLLSQVKRDWKPRLGFDERPLVERTFLHAEDIAFVDVDGSNIAVHAPMTNDLVTALRKLERFAERPR